MVLSDIARSWTDLGTRIEELIDHYVSAVTRVGDSYWEGIAAEAAQHRAQADRSTVITVVDHLTALAKRAEQGFYEVDAPFVEHAPPSPAQKPTCSSSRTTFR